jgi:tRNA pseudouridine55 synthase
VTGRDATDASRRASAAGLHGILVVDKPVGPTSHDVVALARRLSGTRKIGHGGTLDPFASGVLPLYLGVATRIAEFHLGARKAYRATIVFGSVSTTDDLEGQLRVVDGPPPTRDVVAAALAGFLGTVHQRPPAFSARKVGGRRAYALARRGQEPALRPREVTFEALDLVAWNDADPRHPAAIVELTCSAGTYVRALARDLGVATGGGAYLAALRRTAAGPFGIDEARSLDVVRAAAAAGHLVELLRPPGAGLDELPAVTLAAGELSAVAHGGWTGQIERLGPGATTVGDGTAVRLLAPGGDLAAIARVTGAGYLVPDKVLLDRDTAHA